MKRTFMILMAVCLFLLSSCTETQLEEAEEFLSQMDSSDNSVDSNVNLTDLASLNEKYVIPLIPTGDMWLYTWHSASEIRPDDLVYFVCFNNFLDLPLKFGTSIMQGAEYIDHTAPADAVEAEVLKYFDVDHDFIRKSRRYHPDTHTYDMLSGWGGDTGYYAVGAEQFEDKLIFRIAMRNIDTGEYEQQGDLTVQVDNNSFKYLSFVLLDESKSQKERLFKQ